MVWLVVAMVSEEFADSVFRIDATLVTAYLTTKSLNPETGIYNFVGVKYQNLKTTKTNSAD
jgi:hypothetical protein